MVGMANQTSERRGTFRNGIEDLTFSNGPRTMLFLPGGPGSALPEGLALPSIWPPAIPTWWSACPWSPPALR